MGAFVVMPPAKKKGKQFSPIENKQAYEVSKLRVHVEVSTSIISWITRIVYLHCWKSNFNNLLLSAMHRPLEVLPHSPICALAFEKILWSNGKHYCNGGQLTKGSYSLLIYQMDTTILSRSDFIICFKVLYN